MKTKETLKEVAERRYGTDMDSIRGSSVYDLNTDLKRGFIEGIEWAQENFYKQLKKYFETTPKEKVLEDWYKSQEFDKIGPIAEKVIKSRRFFISYIGKYNDDTGLTYGNFIHINTTFPSSDLILNTIIDLYIDKDKISKKNVAITCISELSEEDYLNYIKQDE